MDIDAFAAKKGELQNRDLPFEQEPAGSAEDAAGLESVIEEKNLMVDLSDQMFAGKAENLLKRIKESGEAAMEREFNDYEESDELSAETERLLDYVDKKIAGIQNDPEAPDAASREKFLTKIQSQLADKYDLFALQKKMREEFAAEQRKTHAAEKQAKFQAEIDQPSVVVKPERLGAKPEMPPPAEEDAEPPIHRLVDGKWISGVSKPEPKPAGLWDRAKKLFRKK